MGMEAGEEDWQAGHRAEGQRELRGRRAVRDLNRDLLQLQRRAGGDGSHATRRDRSCALAHEADGRVRVPGRGEKSRTKAGGAPQVHRRESGISAVSRSRSWPKPFKFRDASRNYERRVRSGATRRTRRRGSRSSQ